MQMLSYYTDVIYYYHYICLYFKIVSLVTWSESFSFGKSYLLFEWYNVS